MKPPLLLPLKNIIIIIKLITVVELIVSLVWGVEKDTVSKDEGELDSLIICLCILQQSTRVNDDYFGHVIGD